MQKDEGDKLNEYYKSLQYMFRTDEVELITKKRNYYFFDVKEETIVIIKDLGENNWTIENILKWRKYRTKMSWKK